MLFTEILTIIFVVLKLTDAIDWSWWLVLLPEIVAVLCYIRMIIATVVSVKSMNRSFERMVEKKHKRMNRF